MPTRSHCREQLRERQKVPRQANFCFPLAWVVDPGITRPETNAPHWIQRAGFSQKLVVRAYKVFFLWLDSAWIWRRCRIQGAFFSLSPTPESKLRTPRPMRLRVLGLGDDMMSSTARWSWKTWFFQPSSTAPSNNMARRPRQTTKGTTVGNRMGAARATPL